MTLSLTSPITFKYTNLSTPIRLHICLLFQRKCAFVCSIFKIPLKAVIDCFSLQFMPTEEKECSTEITCHYSVNMVKLQKSGDELQPTLSEFTTAQRFGIHYHQVIAIKLASSASHQVHPHCVQTSWPQET